MGPTATDQYEEYLRKHIQNVQTAARTLGVPHAQLMIHDISKWGPEEFLPYAIHFFSGRPKSETKTAFDRAWLHHIHNNPHHWQHWIIPGTFNTTIEMPQNYVREMIADWIGTEMSIRETWDMSEWLTHNLPHVKLHDATRKLVVAILKDLGYQDLPVLQKEQTP